LEDAFCAAILPRIQTEKLREIDGFFKSSIVQHVANDLRKPFSCGPSPRVYEPIAIRGRSRA
jgi:hypothetical protein